MTCEHDVNQHRLKHLPAQVFAFAIDLVSALSFVVQGEGDLAVLTAVGGLFHGNIDVTPFAREDYASVRFW